MEFSLRLLIRVASLDRGEGRVITQESMRKLADEVKERGRVRLASAARRVEIDLEPLQSPGGISIPSREGN